MELTRERLTIIIAGVIAIVLVGVYTFLYRPLINKCAQAGRECRGLEQEVLQAREAIELLKEDSTKRPLISEKDISVAMDELTKGGRSRGINFTSISPAKIKGSGDPRYKILPIDMEMESTYKELAVYLGSLGELEKGLVTVRDIDAASLKENRAKLKTRLTINMYLSGR